MRFYIFYFDHHLEGEHALATVQAHEMPHRLHKYTASVYGGATALGRGWGQLHIPDFALDQFMELTGNRFAPEPGSYADDELAARRGCWPLS